MRDSASSNEHHCTGEHSGGGSLPLNDRVMGGGESDEDYQGVKERLLNPHPAFPGVGPRGRQDA